MVLLNRVREPHVVFIIPFVEKTDDRKLQKIFLNGAFSDMSRIER